MAFAIAASTTVVGIGGAIAAVFAAGNPVASIFGNGQSEPSVEGPDAIEAASSAPTPSGPAPTPEGSPQSAGQATDTTAAADGGNDTSTNAQDEESGSRQAKREQADEGERAPGRQGEETAQAQKAKAGPVLSKEEAKKALKTEVRSCMKKHDVHHLVTRLGNERSPGGVPPLEIVRTSTVDRQPKPGFEQSPLGQCVARAARATRAPAYGGNYIHLDLTNESASNPLQGASEDLDTAEAQQALSELDSQARECAKRHPRGSRPGETKKVLVYFNGGSGQVSRVRPMYVDRGTPYRECLVSVYEKATVSKFKKSEARVMHTLEP